MTASPNYNPFNRLIIIVFALAALLCFVLVSVSCSPEKRLHDLLVKHPDLMRTDSVTKQVTVIDSSKRFSYAVSMDSLRKRDSVVYLYRDPNTHNTITEHVYLRHDSIFTTVYVPKDTLHSTVYVNNHYYHDTEKWYDKIPWWVYVTVIGLVLLIVIEKVVSISKAL